MEHEKGSRVARLWSQVTKMWNDLSYRISNFIAATMVLFTKPVLASYRFTRKHVGKTIALVLAMIVIGIFIFVFYAIIVYVVNPVVSTISPYTSWWTIALPVFAGLFVLGRLKSRNGSFNNMFSWWPFSEDATWLIALWIGIVLLPLAFPLTRDAWWNKLYTREAFALISFLTLCGWAMKSNPAKPFRHQLGKYGVVIGSIIAIIFVFYPEMKIISFRGNSGRGSRTSNERAIPSGVLNRTQTQDATMKLFYSSMPIMDAREMVNIIQCESGFNHWDRNGSVLTHMNEDGSTDWGVAQINDKAWGAKAKELGHDILTLHGNLEMALYIQKEKGAKEWTGCYDKVQQAEDEVVDILAPFFPEWSPVQKVKANCMWENLTTILIKDDSGKIHKKNRGDVLNVITWTFQISTPEGEPQGTMRFRCR